MNTINYSVIEEREYRLGKNKTADEEEPLIVS